MTGDLASFAAFFIISMMFGWVLDSLYRSIVDRRWVNAGYFVGPICPIYGFGALLLLLMVYFLEGQPLLLRCAVYFAGLSAVEFAGGVFTVRVLRVRLWDYSDAPFNLMGHVDLLHSFYWLALALAFEGVVWPFLKLISSALSGIQYEVNIVVFILTVIIMAGAFIRKLTHERPRIKVPDTIRGSAELNPHLDEVNEKYMRIMAEMEKNIVIPAEAPVREWFDEHEHYLDELHDRAEELKEDLEKVEQRPGVRLIRSEVGELLSGVGEKRRELKRLRRAAVEGLAVGSKPLDSFSDDLSRFRKRSRRRLAGVKAELDWMRYILLRGRSIRPKAFLDRFPAWSGGWKKRYTRLKEKLNE